MNYLLTMLYMYCMITFIYPLVSNLYNINTKLGFGLFILISFLAIGVLNIFYYKNGFNLTNLFNKTILNSLIMFTTIGIIDDFALVDSQNNHMQYLQQLTTNIYTKNIIILFPLLISYIFSALLKPY
jgi:hypothetical protein